MSEELKPCPSCGKAVSLEHNYDITLHNLHKVSIRCIAQNAHYEHALVTGWSDNISGIIEQWNTRAKPTFTKEDVKRAWNAFLLEHERIHNSNEDLEYADMLNKCLKAAVNAVGRVEE